MFNMIDGRCGSALPGAIPCNDGKKNRARKGAPTTEGRSHGELQDFNQRPFFNAGFYLDAMAPNIREKAEKMAAPSMP